MNAAETVTRNILPDNSSIGRDFHGVATGASRAHGRAPGQLTGRQMDNRWVDKDRLALGILECDFKESERIMYPGLPRSEGKQPSLATDALGPPLYCLLSVRAADRAGTVARQVRLIVDLQPHRGEKGPVLEREALLQKIANVNPAVVLLAGQSHLGCQLSCPEVGDAHRASQRDEKHDPGSARQHKLEYERDEDQRNDPPVPQPDGSLARLRIHAASIPDLACPAKGQTWQVHRNRINQAWMLVFSSVGIDTSFGSRYNWALVWIEE